MLSVLAVVPRRPCGFDLVFLEQTVSLIADEDEDMQYLMQVKAQHVVVWRTVCGRARLFVCLFVCLGCHPVCSRYGCLSMLKHAFCLPGVQVLVRWKSKLHLGRFWVLEASGKRWRQQTFMLRVRIVRAKKEWYRFVLRVTFSVAATLAGSCAPTHVAKIHNECAAQI